MKEQIENIVYNFFVNSSDFNGVPLRQVRQVSQELKIEYEDSINIIKTLVSDDKITIQSSTNPHIIYSQLYPIDIQLKILEDAKSWKVSVEKIGETSFISENTEFPICLYPTKNLLKFKRNLNEFGNAVYTKELAVAQPHLKPIFFEIEVLERYANDPRFDFEFKDYSGRISCKYDENEKPFVRKEDEVFLKTFGLGFDENGKRVAVAYLRYLSDLTPEHQIYWKSREKKENCKMLEEYHQNTIQGNLTSSYSVFSGLIGELSCLNEISETIFSKPLFRKNFDAEKRPREFTFFFTPTLKNYNDFVHLLDKMLSENINQDFFRGKMELFDIVEIEDGLVERKPKGTIRLLEDWLSGIFKTEKEDELKDVFRSIKKVRRERQNPAHKISENEYDDKYTELQKKLVSDSYNSMRALRFIFQQHPKAKNFEVPDWLENGKIKTF